MRPAAARLLLAASLAACVACGAASGTSARSGLYGKVTRGPLQPVCRAGVPCDGPASGVTLVFSRDGTVARARTRPGGRYRISLRPGTYTVRISPRGVSLPRPARVSVAQDRFSRVDFFIDTGIR